METRELICINCPMGCNLTVQIDGGEVVSVTGNTCPRGKAYGITEVTHPVRMVTSIVPVENGTIPMVSCKTAQPVDKDKMFDVVQALAKVTANAPVHIGDVLLADAAGTGVDIIATREIPLA